MVYERYTRDRQSSDYYGRPNSQDYGRDFKSDGSDYARSSARDYAAAGEFDRDGGRGERDDGNRYASGDRGQYGREQGGRDYYGGHNDRQSPSDGNRQARSGSSGAGYDRSGYDQSGYRREGYGQQGYGAQQQRSSGGRETEYHGSYASDGRRFEDVRRYRDADDDARRGDRGRGDQGGGRQSGTYGRQPQGYDYDDRGFIARAGDEVRSWFGDDEAERRREADARHDDQSYRRSSADRDDHYHSWRSSQIAEFDRDYNEYRNENRSKFHNEFSTWRTERQGQRTSLSQVTEHMEVVGSDGSHVGTVDKVKGDRILLTKNDKDAGGVHHSIPSRWIKTVDDKVTLSKSADEAKAAWKDEERNSALFDYGDRTGRDRTGGDQTGGGRDTDAARYGSTSSTVTDNDTTNRNRSVTGTDAGTGTGSDASGGSASGVSPSKSFSGTY